MVKNIGRRKFIKSVGVTGASVLAAPYIKTATSAGKLSLGIWDHWIPGANDVLENIILSWGETVSYTHLRAHET